MRPLIFTVILVLITSLVQAQLKKANERYPNGQLIYEGKYLNCSTPDSMVHGLYHHEKRKVGKWVSYNSDGTIKEKREYTKNVKSCETKILKQGIWECFNDAGIHYLTEKYKDDSLLYSEIDIYQKEQFAGKLVKRRGKEDTLILPVNVGLKNLIPNAAFDSYYHRNIRLSYDGKNEIEKLIPYWNSPDHNSPDYYNPYRFVRGIPEYGGTDILQDDSFGLVGLMLYLGIEDKKDVFTTYRNLSSNDHSQNYSETIQVKLLTALESQKKYCLKVKIILSSLSGYTIDQFGVKLSENKLNINQYNNQIIPTIRFKENVNN